LAFSFKSAPHCNHIGFPSTFSVPPGQIAIQISVVHPGSTSTHDAVATWIEGVTSAGFDACVTEDADFDNVHAAARIDWVAVTTSGAETLGAQVGRVSVASALTQACRSVTFSTPFAEAPHVQATLRHAGARASWDDGGTAWFEDVSTTGFRVCLQELESADQVLDQTSIDWFAYPASFSDAGFVAGELDFPAASGISCQDVETGCLDCENVQLTNDHRRRTETSSTFVHQSTLVWAEDLSATGNLRICVRESSENDLVRDAHLSVNWLVRHSND
jgi:hypothetical protein